jgi:hypothetical protein
MEYWSVEINKTSILYPLLQYSSTPKLIEFGRFQDGSLSFGL